MPTPDLPLPDKQFLTIGEVTRHTAVKSHVLRYWERQIPELSAYIERRGNRRYYPLACVEILVRMKALLEQGQTLRGVRTVLFGKKGAVKKRGDSVDIRAQIKQIIDIL